MTYSHKYYLEHREHIILKSKNYKKTHIEKTRESKRNYHARRYKKAKDSLFNLLGRKCTDCGVDDIRVLQFDHINGGGTKDLSRFKKSPRRMYDYYNLNPYEAKKTLQVLCANCNWIKRTENYEVTPRPRFRNHICTIPSNCLICKKYINGSNVRRKHT